MELFIGFINGCLYGTIISLCALLTVETRRLKRETKEIQERISKNKQDWQII